MFQTISKNLMILVRLESIRIFQKYTPLRKQPLPTRTNLLPRQSHHRTLLHRPMEHNKEGAVINGLVKPSCLIIDEIGRCVFDKENTRMFFDVIDRRYNKDGPSTMIFTSNKTPNQWGEYFSEDDTLLCSLDRVFDDATVFMIKGDSYRGRKLETLGLEAGIAKHTEYKNA